MNVEINWWKLILWIPMSGVLIASCLSTFGWKGLGIVAAVYFLAPWHPNEGR